MQLVNFKASNFEGNCWVDEEFAYLLLEMNKIGIKHNIAIIITSSHRKNTNIKGAIVAPAKMSNHLVGHAIDCNLRNIVTKEYYNSKKLGDGTGLDEIFCEDVDRNTDLRWGQAFNTPDSVHFDDALNIKKPKLWLQKYNELYNI